MLRTLAARSALGPTAGDLVFLADARLVGEPNFYAPGSTPFSRPISSKRAGKLPEKLRWRRHLVQHVTERLRASSKVGENPGAISVLVIRSAWVCVGYPMSQGVVEQGG